MKISTISYYEGCVFIPQRKNVTPTAHRLFTDTDTDGGQKGPPPQNLPHISCNDETWRGYTLAREDPKNM